jgi:hypothetical protein
VLDRLWERVGSVDTEILSLKVEGQFGKLESIHVAVSLNSQGLITFRITRSSILQEKLEINFFKCESPARALLSSQQSGRLRQEDYKFKTSLGYTVIPYLKKKKKKKRGIT